MSNFSIAGKLYSATPAETKANNFVVRNFILEVTESTNSGQAYTNYLGFQLTGDKVNLIDGMQPGQPVTVHFNLRGTIWQDKAITNLQAWKIEGAQQQAAPPQYQQPAAQAHPQQWGTPPPPPVSQPQQWGAPPAATPPPAQQPQQWGTPPPASPPPAQPQQWGPPAPPASSGLPF